MSFFTKNKNRKTVHTSLIFALAIGMLISGWFHIQPVFAVLPTTPTTTIGLSASLFNNQNRSIGNGVYQIRFALYTTDRDITDIYPSDTDARLWEETQTVTAKNGLIKVFLGSVNSFPANLNFQTGDYYVGVRIGTDSEMVPRKKLASVPSAINSQYLQGKTIGINKGDIPLIASTGTLDTAILKKINQVGTIANGAWQGTAIADSYIADALTSKTYNGINLLTTTGDHTLTLSSDVTIDQNLSLTSDVAFNSLSLVTALSSQSGGTGINTSASTGVPYITAGTWSVDATSLAIAHGGTNATTIGSAGSVPYSTGTAYDFSAVGTAGQCLLSGATGSPTWGACGGGGISAIGDTITSATAGSILFATTSGALAQDNANFFWDDTNNRLGIGTTNPAARLTIDNTAVPTGSELVTNGTFTGGTTGWILGSDVTYGTNNVVSTFAGGDPSLSTTFSTVAGNTYLLTFTVSAANNTVYFYLNNNTLPYNYGPFNNGIVTVAFQSDFTGTETITFDDWTYDNGDTWTIDSVSIKQTTLPSSGLDVIGFDGAKWLSLGGDLLGNIAMGNSAGFSNTTGMNNSFFGSYAGYSNTTGSSNSFIGNFAGQFNTTGSSNSFLGYATGYSNTTGSSNSFLGYAAGSSNTTGSSNSFLGSYAGSSNTTGYSNSFLGYFAGSSNTTGLQNSFLGTYAGLSNTTGLSNSFLGTYAGYSNTTGFNNTGSGVNAFFDLGSAQTAGAFNIGTNYTIKTVGTTDFTLIGSVDNNVGTVFTASGVGTGTGTATPNNTDSNTAIGYNTGRGIIYGSNNTILGANVTGLSAGLSNNIILADGAGNQRINVGATGNVGIGDTTPASLFTVGNTDLFQINSSGAITSATGITSSSTITFSGLATAGIVTNTSGGVLSTTATISVANGGTNATTIGGAGSVPYSTGTAYGFSAVGTAGQCLLSGAAGSPTWGACGISGVAIGDTITSATAGSIFFAGASGILQQDNANFFWDDTNNRLGIGTTTPGAMLAINGTVAPTGSELVTNGTFTGSATGWTLGDCAVYGANVVTVTLTSCADASISTTFATTSGTNYILTFTLSGVSDDLVYLYFNNNGQSFEEGPFGNGTHTLVFSTDYAGTETITFDSWNYNNGGIWTIDDVSIKTSGTIVPALEVIGYDGSTWLSVGGDILGNTVLGKGALSSNTTGSENTANGSFTLSSNITGSYNTANGYNALLSNTTGNDNTGSGFNALLSNTTGYRNTGSGANALSSNTTGFYNTANGASALYTNTTGFNNTAIGGSALSSNTTGTDNTASGYQSLYSNTTGDANTALGNYSLASNITGSDNTGSGLYALYSNTTGFNNTGSGENALYSNTTGTQNTASGRDVLYSNTTGSYNTVNGVNALSDLGSAQTAGAFNIGTSYTIASVGTTDFTLIGAASNTIGVVFTATGVGSGTGTATPNATNSNTAIGYGTGLGIIYGSNNTILGANVTGLSAGLSNNIILADGAGNQRINVGATGNVGIGDTTPASLFTVGATSQFQVSSTGAVTAVGVNSGTGLIQGTGGLTITGTVTLPNSSITNSMLAGSITASNLVGIDIATVGTITAGVWNGTAITVAGGGTGLSSYAVGDILYASGPTAISKLADVATGSILVSGGIGVAPGWSTAPTLTTSITAPQLISTIAIGTAPLTVTSTTKVTNLNADLLDGLDSSAFGDATLANQQQMMAKESSLLGLPVFGGDGSDGAGPSGANALTSAIKQYSSWTVDGAITDSETGPTGLFIAVSGTLTISTGGTISVTGKGQPATAPGPGKSCRGEAVTTSVNVCVSGAGGGANAGGASYSGGGGGGAGGANSGGAGGATAQAKLTLARIMKTNIFSFYDGSSNNTLVGLGPLISGASGASVSVGSVGGSGGGVIYIEANTVTTTIGTAIITANGGASNGDGSYCGGGGGGGIVWIRAKSLTGINTTTVTATGGAGGTGCSTNGGAGAAGFVLIEKVN